VGGSPIYSPNVTAKIQGFDLATGKTIWSFDAGHDVRAFGEGALPQTGQDSIVLKTGSSATALNLSTGATRRLKSNTRAWCDRMISSGPKEPAPTA
jgi:outer membrane protein assembly factor BamB